jgi:hypothetical protein
MKNGTVKTIFGSIAAGALALTPVAAFSQAAPANQNVTPVAASVQQLQVQFVDVQNDAVPAARRLAAIASRDKVAIVIWGGNRAIQQEAYNAARDLVEMGIPTAFVLAPDHNSLDDEAVTQVYAASTPRSDGHYGTDHANLVRADMRNAGIAAYREAFPQQLAALALR